MTEENKHSKVIFNSFSMLSADEKTSTIDTFLSQLSVEEKTTVALKALISLSDKEQSKMMSLLLSKSSTESLSKIEIQARNICFKNGKYIKVVETVTKTHIYSSMTYAHKVLYKLLTDKDFTFDSGDTRDCPYLIAVVEALEKFTYLYHPSDRGSRLEIEKKWIPVGKGIYVDDYYGRYEIKLCSGKLVDYSDIKIDHELIDQFVESLSEYLIKNEGDEDEEYDVTDYLTEYQSKKHLKRIVNSICKTMFGTYPKYCEPDSESEED